MNELERLSYLDALGIQQWISRASDMGITLHAQESSLLSLSAFIAEPEVEAQADVEGASPEKPVLETATKHNHRTEKQSVNDVVEKVLLQNAQTKTSPKKDVASYALLQLSQAGKYFIFADIQDSSGKIIAGEQQLLNNICSAINKVLNVSGGTSRPDFFKWPMFASKFDADHIDQSEQAAIESAQAFVSARIKSQGLPLLILLGEQAQKLILEPGKISGNEQHSHYLKTAVFANEKIIASVSLQYMLENPASKAMLWRCLCEYFNEL